MKSSFTLNWRSFVLGMVLGMLGFLISLFATKDRRDKMYSALMGWFLATGIFLLLLHFGFIDIKDLVMVPQN